MSQQGFEEHQAAKLNNEGVNALLAGNPKLAFRPLANALRLMKAELVSTLTTTSHRNATTANIKNHEIRTVVIHGMESCDTIAFNQAIKIVLMPTRMINAAEEEQHHYLSNGHLLEQEYDEESRISTFVAAVVFNLALAYHFAGSCPNTPFPTMIKKAEGLYGMVLQLLDGDTTCLVLVEDMMHVVLIIKSACINNLSQIRYSKGDCDGARMGLLRHDSSLQGSSSTGFEEPDAAAA
jgi:hypothetical protein